MDLYIFKSDDEYVEDIGVDNITAIKRSYDGLTVETSGSLELDDQKYGMNKKLYQRVLKEYQETKQVVFKIEVPVETQELLFMRTIESGGGGSYHDYTTLEVAINMDELVESATNTYDQYVDPEYYEGQDLERCYQVMIDDLRTSGNANFVGDYEYSFYIQRIPVPINHTALTVCLYRSWKMEHGPDVLKVLEWLDFVSRLPKPAIRIVCEFREGTDC